MPPFDEILIADDDEDDIELLSESLSVYAKSAHVITVENGFQCITYLKSHRLPALIFLDLNMPKITGIECLQWMKQEHIVEQTATIVFSTSHSYKDIEACYDLGALFYMVKPIHPAALNRLLSQLFHSLVKPATEQLRNKNFFLLLDEEILWE